jgi:hypothetical protein
LGVFTFTNWTHILPDKVKVLANQIRKWCRHIRHAYIDIIYCTVLYSSIYTHHMLCTWQYHIYCTIYQLCIHKTGWTKEHWQHKHPVRLCLDFNWAFSLWPQLSFSYYKQHGVGWDRNLQPFLFAKPSLLLTYPFSVSNSVLRTQPFSCLLVPNSTRSVTNRARDLVNCSYASVFNGSICHGLPNLRSCLLPPLPHPIFSAASVACSGVDEHYYPLPPHTRTISSVAVCPSVKMGSLWHWQGVLCPGPSVPTAPRTYKTHPCKVAGGEALRGTEFGWNWLRFQMSFCFQIHWRQLVCLSKQVLLYFEVGWVLTSIGISKIL